MNSPIALLTDFGLRDHYVAVMKGVILSIYPEAKIVDLSHGVEPQNILQAALLLENSFSYFPERTIFVCVVDPGVGTKRKIICVKTKKYYFLAPDNGLLTLALRGDKAFVIRSVENQKYFLTSLPSFTFHGRDIFSPVAAYLAHKNIFNDLGPALTAAHELHVPKIKKTKKGIEGEIIYFDHFGNAITNIGIREADEEFWGKAKVWVKEIGLGKLRSNYAIKNSEMPIVLFNSSSQLEIAMPGGSAREIAGLEVGDRVIITQNEYEEQKSV